MIHFTLEEKLAIASACAAVVALLATIMICNLSPACLLYRLCPYRATVHDDDDDEEMAVKVHANYKHRYKLIDYNTLLPVVPSIKVTTLDETLNATSYRVPNQWKNFCVTSPAKDGLVMSGAPSGTFFLTRPARQSTSSISGSSTASGERVSPHRARVFPRLRKNSGSGTLSSDCDDTICDLPPSSLEIGLQYNEAQEKLVIVLYRARRIPPNVYGGANDSFVQVVIGKNNNKYWRRRSEVPVDDLLRRQSVSPTALRTKTLAVEQADVNGGYSKLAEFRTRVIRKDAEPVFKESFLVGDVKAKEKRHVWIKFILHSIDRFSHQYVVGTRQVALDRAAPAEADIDREKFNIVLDQYSPNLGDMTLTLCYMPTAARLVVTIAKITNLKPPDGLVAANPYIKGVILRRGKVLEKRVTESQLRAMNPTYSEEPLVFDVPASELGRIVLLLTVVHDDALSDVDGSPATDGANRRRRSIGSSLEAASALESNLPLNRSRSNSCMPTKRFSTPLGRLAFGSHAAVDAASRRHWAEMMSNPRKRVVQTHKLRP